MCVMQTIQFSSFDAGQKESSQNKSFLYGKFL